MGIASLVLGIIAFLIAFSIFKDVSLILAVLSVVLGIISIVKKKNKGMSIAGIIIAIIALIILFSVDTGTTITSGDVDNNNSGKTQTSIYNLGDTITVKDNLGDEYTLQITNIKESKERNQFSDKNPVQVFVVDYTYSCSKSNDTLYISDMNFKIIDEQGEIGESYPVSVKDPQSITAGTTCKAQMAFGVYNNSNKVKLQFFSNMFNGTPTAIYEINL